MTSRGFARCLPRPVAVPAGSAKTRFSYSFPLANVDWTDDTKEFSRSVPEIVPIRLPLIIAGLLAVLTGRRRFGSVPDRFPSLPQLPPGGGQDQDVINIAEVFHLQAPQPPVQSALQKNL